MYIGSDPINMDAKGRLAFPMRHRQRLLDDCNGSVVATLNPQAREDASKKSLVIYPRREWERVARQVSEQPTLAPGVQDFQRYFLGNAAELEMDRSGRILIPTLLREFAALDKKVVLLGQNFKFELWNEQAYLEDQTQAAGIPDAVRSLVL